MTADEYAKQRDELERGIAYAERDYNSAAFRLQTGAAKPEQVAEAKAHYEAMKGKLDELVAAFHGAQIALRQKASAAKTTAHKQLSDEVEAFIKRRAGVLDAIAKHAEALASAIAEHQDATADVRKVLHAFVTKHGGSGVLDGINITLQNGPSPFGIAGSVLADNQVSPAMLSGTVGAFRERSAAEMEARFAEQLRGNVTRLAPKEA